MESIGAYEAKTHLSRLLQLVAQGEKVIITKHGVPVAMLQPPDSARQVPAKEVIAEIRAFRNKHSLKGLSLKEMIEEGGR
ncbi:MAG: type II toxin-antitoxin system prevent-host-death family antitoxin [Desulfobulbus sp.]|nr:MAG: type II toxin-antitoxin system prevent-host-death family antitoxin [Desulfobulbus sp.]